MLKNRKILNNTNFKIETNMSCQMKKREKNSDYEILKDL